VALVVKLSAPVAPFRLSSGNPTPMSEDWTGKYSRLVAPIAASVIELAAPVAPFRLSSGNPTRMSIFKDWTAKSSRLAGPIVAPL
jgi:hypothetical protein